eukprot:2781742-Prymnesium_polylepis.1
MGKLELSATRVEAYTNGIWGAAGGVASAAGAAGAAAAGAAAAGASSVGASAAGASAAGEIGSASAAGEIGGLGCDGATGTLAQRGKRVIQALHLVRNAPVALPVDVVEAQVDWQGGEDRHAVSPPVENTDRRRPAQEACAWKHRLTRSSSDRVRAISVQLRGPTVRSDPHEIEPSCRRGRRSRAITPYTRVLLRQRLRRHGHRLHCGGRRPHLQA